MGVAQKVWPAATVVITRADGSKTIHEKVRFLAIDGTITVMDAGGNVLDQFIPERENEVSDRLVTYHGAEGVLTADLWHVQNAAGGCGCGK